jgi:hypothetical protein
MKHLLIKQASARKNRFIAACGKVATLGECVKSSELHDPVNVVDCPAGCQSSALARLRSHQEALSENAVTIHNKQVLIGEAIQRYKSLVEG